MTILRKPRRPDADIHAIVAEYAPNHADDDRVRAVKDAVLSLTEAERRILILYADSHNVAAVARTLGVSRGAAHKAINVARSAVLHYLHEHGIS